MAPQDAGTSVCIVLGLVLTTGCAWRSGGVEHYIGPVSFRYVSPPSGKAYVGQVVRWGLSTEGGSSWGISVGMSERIGVAPLSSSKIKSKSRLPRWSMPLSLVQTPAENQWHWSLFYLRVEDMPPPVFFSRSVCGLEAVMGQEVTTFSIGLAHRTLSTPPEQAFSTLHFETARPMETRAKVWSGGTENNGLPADLLNEEIEK